MVPGVTGANDVDHLLRPAVAARSFVAGPPCLSSPSFGRHVRQCEYTRSQSSQRKISPKTFLTVEFLRVVLVALGPQRKARRDHAHENS